MTTEQKTLNIDTDFQALLPKLDEKEQEHLEKSIKADGVNHPIILWKGKNIIVDGHNRYAIASKLKINFPTVERAFKTKQEVKDYIMMNQLARRNLTPMLKTYYLGELYNKEKQDSTTGKRVSTGGVRASEKIAKKHGVNEKTARRAGKVAEGVNLLDEGVNAKDATPDIKALQQKLNKSSVINNESGLTRDEIAEVSKAPSPKAAVKKAAKIIHKKAPKALPKEAVPEKPAKTYGFAFYQPDVDTDKHDRPTCPLPDQPALAANSTVYIHVEDWALPAALRLMTHWKVDYKGTIVITKKETEEMAFTNCSHEFLVVGTTGIPAGLPESVVTNSVVASKGDVMELIKKIITGHSEKKPVLDISGKVTAVGWEKEAIGG
jgi:ParB-like chromosome segregation protein Spo0J